MKNFAARVVLLVALAATACVGEPPSPAPSSSPVLTGSGHSLDPVIWEQAPRTK